MADETRPNPWTNWKTILALGFVAVLLLCIATGKPVEKVEVPGIGTVTFNNDGDAGRDSSEEIPEDPTDDPQPPQPPTDPCQSPVQAPQDC